MQHRWILIGVVIALIAFLGIAPIDFKTATITGFAARQGMIGTSAASTIVIGILALLVFALIFRHVNRQRPA